jgi:hypothetical protein
VSGSAVADDADSRRHQPSTAMPPEWPAAQTVENTSHPLPSRAAASAPRTANVTSIPNVNTGEHHTPTFDIRQQPTHCRRRRRVDRRCAQVNTNTHTSTHNHVHDITLCGASGTRAGSHGPWPTVLPARVSRAAQRVLRRVALAPLVLPRSLRRAHVARRPHARRILRVSTDIVPPRDAQLTQVLAHTALAPPLTRDRSRIG